MAQWQAIVPAWLRCSPDSCGSRGPAAPAPADQATARAPRARVRAVIVWVASPVAAFLLPLGQSCYKQFDRSACASRSSRPAVAAYYAHIARHGSTVRRGEAGPAQIRHAGNCSRGSGAGGRGWLPAPADLDVALLMQHLREGESGRTPKYVCKVGCIAWRQIASDPNKPQPAGKRQSAPSSRHPR